MEEVEADAKGHVGDHREGDNHASGDDVEPCRHQITQAGWQMYRDRQALPRQLRMWRLQRPLLA